MDGKIVVCGGAKVDFYSDCYSLQVGKNTRLLFIDLRKIVNFAFDL